MKPEVKKIQEEILHRCEELLSLIEKYDLRKKTDPLEFIMELMELDLTLEHLKLQTSKALLMCDNHAERIEFLEPIINQGEIFKLKHETLVQKFKQN